MSISADAPPARADLEALALRFTERRETPATPASPSVKHIPLEVTGKVVLDKVTAGMVYQDFNE